jgi:hypothetical protein
MKKIKHGQNVNLNVFKHFQNIFKVEFYREFLSD